MSLTFFAKGRMWSVSADHPNFEKIRDYLRASEHTDVDVDEVIGLYDERHALVTASAGRLAFIDDQLAFDGEVLTNGWADLIFEMKNDNEPFGPVFKALASLMGNPSPSVRDRVIDFVSKQRLGFLPDGRIAALMVVRDDYSDVRGTGTLSPVGATVQAAGDDKLLVGALGYLSHNLVPSLLADAYDFGPLAPNRKVMLTAFWPHDVRGADGMKLNVSAYQVLDELDPATINDFVRANSRVVRGYVDETADAAVSEGPTNSAEQVAAPVQRVSPFRRRNRQAA